MATELDFTSGLAVCQRALRERPGLSKEFYGDRTNELAAFDREVKQQLADSKRFITECDIPLTEVLDRLAVAKDNSKVDTDCLEALNLIERGLPLADERLDFAWRLSNQLLELRLQAKGRAEEKTLTRIVERIATAKANAKKELGYSLFVRSTDLRWRTAYESTNDSRYRYGAATELTFKSTVRMQAPSDSFANVFGTLVRVLAVSCCWPQSRRSPVSRRVLVRLR
jgi:hypothetical protein